MVKIGLHLPHVVTQRLVGSSLNGRGQCRRPQQWERDDPGVVPIEGTSAEVAELQGKDSIMTTSSSAWLVEVSCR